MFETIFYFFFLIIFYVYFGYPIIIYLVATINSKIVKINDNYEPTISLVISAYNEESVIEEKIKNCLSLDYPKQKLEMIIFSDASTDRTDEIIKRYSRDGIKLLQLSERRGKTAGQNIAIAQTHGEIVVFSDANVYYQEDTIRKIVSNFYDPSVGCVCGEHIYINEDRSLIGDTEKVYWDYEKFIKRQESRAASILGVNGSIYAVRRELYIPLPEEIISDFIEPLKIIEQGYRVIYEPKAYAFEQSNTHFHEEYNRKKRIINRSFFSLIYYHSFLNPVKYPMLSFQLLSHKILRWLIPFYLLIIFIVNLFLLDKLFFQVSIGLQIIFYGMALLGYLVEKNNWHNVLFYTPFYFCLVNIASFEAVASVLFKRKTVVTWSPVRIKKTIDA